MVMAPDVKMERLTRFLFTAPSWPRSVVIILFLGIVVDAATARLGEELPFFGTLAFAVPAISAFILTKPLVSLFGGSTTWNRSALLALACMVFAVIASFLSVVSPMRVFLPLFYAFSLGLVFGVRLLVLVAVADYRSLRMVVPALTQSAAGFIVGAFLFEPPILGGAIVSHLVFGLGCILLIWLIERPLYRAFQIHGLDFLNTFIAHLTDGDKRMEDFFRDIGEEVYVPQASFFLRRAGKRDVIFTVPNVHPGPMGDVGGGNLPRILYESFDADVMVTHGCATHDFNLVSESEIAKIVEALRRSMEDLRYSARASRSWRLVHGSVQILCQRFGDSLLLVSTRAPEKTEDLDFCLGSTIMAEGHRRYRNVAFVDAHNAMSEVSTPVHPATFTATEYVGAAYRAIDESADLPLHPFRIGYSHISLPFTRDQGFGDLGIQALAVEADGQRTAYLLMDGNNMVPGLREAIQERIAPLVDASEVMTTDSHVVNTISGRNPIGLAVPAEEILPLAEQAVRDALSDLGDAEAAASTAFCERVVIFGSQRVTQLATTVNTILVFIAPLSLAILLLAFLLSILVFVALG